MMIEATGAPEERRVALRHPYMKRYMVGDMEDEFVSERFHHGIAGGYGAIGGRTKK